jgi:hypothetical protein
MKQNIRIGVCEVNTSGTSDKRDYSLFLTLPIFQDSIVEIWITIL